jgi:glycosyltransferase involved in cell wall biosynthesis
MATDPRRPAPAGPEPAAAAPDLRELVASSTIRRVHILAWRDLADVEAGGSELHAATVARTWAAAGLDITMRASYAQGHPPDERRDGYRVVRRRGRYMIFPAAVVAELRHLQGPRDALVEIWNGVPFLSPLWARGPRCTWIHHVHRNMWGMVLEDPRLARIGELLETRIIPPLYRRTPIVTLSESSRDELVHDLHFKADNVLVVPPGVDDRFHPDATVDESRRPLVVAVGRLMPPKRFDELIRIVADVQGRVPDVELAIVGDGSERAALRDLVESLGLQDHVRFLGRVDDDELVDLYRRAWVLASASIAEGWGMTVTEAAATGTPAVVTDISGHRDSVADGVSGLLAATSRQLADQLATVLTDDDLRARLAEGAREHAARFTWEATAANLFVPLARQARRRGRRGRPGRA